METFKKVYIKSEEDLPKEEDPVISHSIYGHIGFRRHVPNKKYQDQTFENISSSWWMENIDWYLKPVEIPEITDEEIEVEAERLGEREDSNKQKFIDGNYFEGFVDCAKWYREEQRKRMTK